MASNIINLTSQHFQVMGHARKSLCLNLDGIFLVYFTTSGECPGCVTFRPIFQKLSKIETRVKFAQLDVYTYRDVGIRAKETTTPIQSVPKLILYINQHPRATFTGTRTETAIQSFITKAFEEIQQSDARQVASQPFMQQPPPPKGLYGNQAPMKGQSGYNAPTQGNRAGIYQPEIGNAPSMNGIIKKTSGGQNTSYNEQDQADDEPKLLMPNNVIPYNKPWDADYRVLNDGDQ